MKRQAVVVEGERLEISCNKTPGGVVEATIGGRSYNAEVVRVSPGVYWMGLGGRSLEVAVSDQGGTGTVSIGGHTISVELLDDRKALQRALERGHEGTVDVRAPMPGKIVRLLAAEGTEIEAGQAIVTMEAMKMQNELRSPKSGKVRKLAVAEGAAVRSGDLIAQIE